MRVLALETSTEYCSVALWQDGKINHRSALAGQKHSELLMEMIAVLLGEASVKIAQLDGIAFGSGPGSFTGVRIACAVTQGLAVGAGLPVASISTLLALAEGSGKMRVIAALDARMGEIYHAAYEKRGADWITISEPCLCKPETAPLLESGDWFAVGSGFAMYQDVLNVRYTGQLQGVDVSAVPQAAAVATLGAAQLVQGLGMDAALAMPLYLRNKVALKTSERVPKETQIESLKPR